MNIPGPRSLLSRLRARLPRLRPRLSLSTVTFLAGAALILSQVPGTLMLGGILVIVSVVARWFGR